MKKTFVISIVVLALFLTLGIPQLWNKREELSGTAELTGSIEGEGIALEADGNNPITARVRAEPLRPSENIEASSSSENNPPFSTAIQNAESITEFLNNASASFGWTKAEIAANFRLWNEACEQAQGISKAPLDAPPDLQLPKHLIGDARALAEFCSDSSRAYELMALELLEDYSLGGLPTLTNVNEFGSYLRGNSLTKQDLGRAIELLDDSLSAHNEDAVMGIVSIIAGRRLFQSPALENAEFQLMGLHLTNEVATTLLCSRGDGCRGQDHPMVLRFCFQRFIAGELCSNPTSIEEAIFQTTSPNKYNWYLLYSGYLQSELRKHSG